MAGRRRRGNRLAGEIEQRRSLEDEVLVNARRKRLEPRLEGPIADKVDFRGTPLLNSYTRSIAPSLKTTPRSPLARRNRYAMYCPTSSRLSGVSSKRRAMRWRS